MKRRLILFIIAGVMTLAIPGCKNREAESPGSATEVNTGPAEEADENTFSFENLSNLEFSFSRGGITYEI